MDIGANDIRQNALSIVFSFRRRDYSAASSRRAVFVTRLTLNVKYRMYQPILFIIARRTFFRNLPDTQNAGRFARINGALVIINQTDRVRRYRILDSIEGEGERERERGKITIKRSNYPCRQFALRIICALQIFKIGIVKMLIRLRDREIPRSVIIFPANEHFEQLLQVVSPCEAIHAIFSETIEKL